MDINAIFQDSFLSFQTLEKSLVDSQVSERCLCARLALHLELKARKRGGSNYFADVEYNRNKGKKKTLINQEYKEITICCDLLLHSRGKHNPDNLIAIEMKKSGRNKQETFDDFERLKVLTRSEYENEVHNEKHVCGYLLGIFILINYQSLCFELTFFEHGQETCVKNVPFY